MERDETPQGYQKPQVIDYGTLVELTAGHHHHHAEDGLGKNHDGPDPSHPHR
jgi:hypothetical protein